MKDLYWIGTSLEDLKKFPEEVKQMMGYALHLAQIGKKHGKTKPLKGFSGAGVLEIVDDFYGNAYRSIYTVKFGRSVYVLHAFQKKSKSGIKTPKQEMELVRQRLLAAKEHYQSLVEE